MEIRRQPLQTEPQKFPPKNADELRVRQLRARQMLRGELEDSELGEYVESRLGLTTLAKAQNWARANAPWPLTFGLGCLPVRRRGLPRVAPPGRHDHPLGPRGHEDGPGHPPHL